MTSIAIPPTMKEDEKSGSGVGIFFGQKRYLWNHGDMESSKITFLGPENTPRPKSIHFYEKKHPK